jgi:hypothetical protein
MSTAQVIGNEVGPQNLFELFNRWGAVEDFELADNAVTDGVTSGVSKIQLGELLKQKDLTEQRMWAAHENSWSKIQHTRGLIRQYRNKERGTNASE